ncbi:MAG: OmpA family protein [Hydrogenimonas sp.]|nr:OmpA family protein [Hydrogenimonas sp.]
MLLLSFLLIFSVSLYAEYRSVYSLTPVLNRYETLGKALLDDDNAFGIRVGYNFDEQLGAEVEYSFLKNFTILDQPDSLSTDGHKLLANILIHLKDDEGFIPYMTMGLGGESYSNAKGSLKGGFIGAFGLGAHFLVKEPFSVRFEVRDIVRLSDFGHTFNWTFGVECGFGKLEKSCTEELFSYYYAPKDRGNSRYAYEERKEKKSESIDDFDISNTASGPISQKREFDRSRYKHTKIAAVSQDRVAKEKSSLSMPATTSASDISHVGPIAPSDVNTATKVIRGTTLHDKKPQSNKSFESIAPIDSDESGSKDAAANITPKSTALSIKDGVKVAQNGKVDGENSSGESFALKESIAHFDFDSAILHREDLAKIEQLAAFLKKRESFKVKVEGHTDSIGSVEYNYRLSLKRAEAVKKALVDFGVEPQRVVVKGYGESRPIADNDTKEGRAKNRRADAVTITVVKK